MKLTIQQLMQIVPMDDRMRLQFRVTYETASQLKQFRLARLLWRQYDKFLDLRVQENLALAMLDKKINSAGKDFYDDLREQSERELLAEANDTISAKRLASVRELMEKFKTDVEAVKE